MDCTISKVIRFLQNVKLADWTEQKALHIYSKRELGVKSNFLKGFIGDNYNFLISPIIKLRSAPLTHF